MRQRLIFRCDPPLRQAAAPVRAQQYHRERDGSEWKPTPGDLSSLMVKFRFSPVLHGSHVALRMQQLGLRGRSSWLLTGAQLVQEISRYLRLACEDLARAEAMGSYLDAGADQLPDGFRWSVGDWLIPEGATAPQARRRVWDTAQAGEAMLRGEPDYAIPLVDVADPGSVWNAAFFSSLLARSRAPDRLTNQVILGRGVLAPFKGTWDTLLCRNSVSFLANLKFGQETTRAEVAEGLVSQPTQWLQTWPTKLYQSGVVTIFRRGKEKPRTIGNLSLEGRSALMQAASTNAGWQTHRFPRHYPDRHWNGPPDFKQDCGIVRPAHRVEDFEIRVIDWKRTLALQLPEAIVVVARRAAALLNACRVCTAQVSIGKSRAILF